MNRKVSGATLLEIIIAMLVIAMIAAGIMTAFSFSRQVTHRSGGELQSMGFVQDISEQLRGAVQAPLANGLTLAPGIYVDSNMKHPPTGANQLAALNITQPDFQRFLTGAGTTADMVGHGDGRIYVVEGAPRDTNGTPGIQADEIAAADLDGDGQTGIDLTIPPDGVTELFRVRVKVKWTTPQTQ